jgi:hypothetical protein
MRLIGRVRRCWVGDAHWRLLMLMRVMELGLWIVFMGSRGEGELGI